MSAPAAGISPLAAIGQPAEHRDHRGRYWSRDDGPFTPITTMALVDASALVEAFVTVDAGITSPTKIGPRVWLMKHVHVGHDAEIGADCELAPGTIIGGHAVLEDGVRVGIGAAIQPFVRVGAGSRIGSQANVTKDVPPGRLWYGNPARDHGPWPKP